MAKRSGPQGKELEEAKPKGGDAKDAPAKGAAGNGAATQQAELDLAAQSASGKAAAPAQPQPAAEPIVVVELVNGVEGVWKKLSNGKRVDLTTKEWRQELARLFTRAPAP